MLPGIRLRQASGFAEASPDTSADEPSQMMDQVIDPGMKQRIDIPR
jgi:hypothetical protein